MPVEFIQRSWLFFFFAFAIYMYLFAFAGWHVQEDARKRGLGKAAVTFWSVGTVFFGPIFVPLYLFFKARAVFAVKPGEKESDEHYRLCPHCGAKNPENEKVCRECKKLLDSMAGAVGEKSCPYCGAMNPVEARRCKSCDQVIGYAEDNDD